MEQNLCQPVNKTATESATVWEYACTKECFKLLRSFVNVCLNPLCLVFNTCFSLHKISNFETVEALL